jgi:hypothetical protein
LLAPEAALAAAPPGRDFMAKCDSAERRRHAGHQIGGLSFWPHKASFKSRNLSGAE